MTGSLQIDKGKYYAVLNLKDEYGKRRQKRINLHIEALPGNKRKAEKALRDVLTEYEEKRITVYKKDIQFCDFILSWLEEARDNLQFNSYEAYKNTIDKHIFPYFKTQSVSLMNVAYSDIKAYYSIKAKTLSGNTLKKHHSIIRQALRTAVQEGLISSNPSADITLPKAKKFTGSFLTVEQGNVLLETVRGSPLEPVVVLAMMYGLRRSEVAGLKWSAIDFKDDTLTIQHTVTRYLTVLAKDETKTKSSHRTLPLNQAVKTFLLRLRSQQAQDKLFMGQAYHSVDYVCRWPDGHALSPHYMSSAFCKLLEKNNLPHVRLHDLRHSCASYMLKAGCSFKEIQTWLGHRQISTTLDIYTHLDADSKKEAANRLEKMIALKV